MFLAISAEAAFVRERLAVVVRDLVTAGFFVISTLIVLTGFVLTGLSLASLTSLSTSKTVSTTLSVICSVRASLMLSFCIDIPFVGLTHVHE